MQKKIIIILFTIFILLVIFIPYYVKTNRTYTCSKKEDVDFAILESNFVIKMHNEKIENIVQNNIYKFSDINLYNDYQKYINFDSYKPTYVKKNKEQKNIIYSWNIDLNNFTKTLEEYENLLIKQGYTCN